MKQCFNETDLINLSSFVEQGNIYRWKYLYGVEKYPLSSYLGNGYIHILNIVICYANRKPDHVRAST